MSTISTHRNTWSWLGTLSTSATPTRRAPPATARASPATAARRGRRSLAELTNDFHQQSAPAAVARAEEPSPTTSGSQPSYPAEACGAPCKVDGRGSRSIDRGDAVHAAKRRTTVRKPDARGTRANRQTAGPEVFDLLAPKPFLPVITPWSTSLAHRLCS